LGVSPDLGMPLRRPVLFVITQELLERHDPECPLLIKPFHRVMKPLSQKDLDPLLVPLYPIHIDELVLRRTFLELAELRNRIFRHGLIPLPEIGAVSFEDRKNLVASFIRNSASRSRSCLREAARISFCARPPTA